MVKDIIMVGCGGIGGFLIPSLMRTVKSLDRLITVDNDTVELKNLFRQSYTLQDVGVAKVSVLEQRYSLLASQTDTRCFAVADWFTDVLVDRLFSTYNLRAERTCIISAVDNNPARLAMLAAVDKYKCHHIVAGNHESSFRAYYYNSSLKGTDYDPRVRYPAMLNDKSDDPLSCQSQEVMESAPQTTLANNGAAIYATMLAADYLDNLEDLVALPPKVLSFELEATAFSVQRTTFDKLGDDFKLFKDFEK